MWGEYPSILLYDGQEQANFSSIEIVKIDPDYCDKIGRSPPMESVKYGIPVQWPFVEPKWRLGI